jgi:hypothetical protein
MGLIRSARGTQWNRTTRILGAKTVQQGRKQWGNPATKGQEFHQGWKNEKPPESTGGFCDNIMQEKSAKENATLLDNRDGTFLLSLDTRCGYVSFRLNPSGSVFLSQIA